MGSLLRDRDTPPSAGRDGGAPQLRARTKYIGRPVLRDDASAHWVRRYVLVTMALTELEDRPCQSSWSGRRSSGRDISASTMRTFRPPSWPVICLRCRPYRRRCVLVATEGRLGGDRTHRTVLRPRPPGFLRAVMTVASKPPAPLDMRGRPARCIIRAAHDACCSPTSTSRRPAGANQLPAALRVACECAARVWATVESDRRLVHPRFYRQQAHLPRRNIRSVDNQHVDPCE
jgi:hypothetical protein